MADKNKSEVVRLVEGLFRSLELAELHEKGEIRLSVPLSQFDNARLGYWAKQFDYSKGRFAADLLSAALKDVEIAGGISEDNYKDYYEKVTAVSEEDSK